MNSIISQSVQDPNSVGSVGPPLKDDGISLQHLHSDLTLDQEGAQQPYYVLV